MQSFRIVSFFLVFLTLGLATIANPVEKRQDLSGIESILSDLETEVDAVLPQISALGTTDSTTQDDITPLMDTLTDAVTTATTALGGLGTSATTKRQSVDAIATIIADIITDIGTTLDTVLAPAESLPVIGDLVTELDTALSDLLTAVSDVVTDVAGLVDGLLANSTSLLSGVGLGSTLSGLGL